MIIEDISFSKLLWQYGISYDALSDEQKESLEAQGDIDAIKRALEFLVNELGVPAKSIEKCPSVLYLNPDGLKNNYQFLLDVGINREKIIGCLHVLSTPDKTLRETYEFVSKHYGEETFNKNVSILSVPVYRIAEMQTKFSKRISNQAILSAAITTLRIPEVNTILGICEERGVEVTGSFFQKGVGEITEIINICRDNGVEITGSVFRKSSDEVKRIITVCREKGIEVIGSVFLKDAHEIGNIIDTCRSHNIEITGSVFRRDAEEIDEIVKVCSECDIKISGTVFLRTADEIRRIVSVCKTYDIPISANVFKKSADDIESIVKVCKKHSFAVSTSLFSKSASSLDKSMSYISDNYGGSYLTPLIVIIDSNHLQKVFPYLDSKGVLPAVVNSPAILSLKFDEIVERENFVKAIGEDDVVNGRFNSIYGLSRKKYDEKMKTVTKGGMVTR